MCSPEEAGGPGHALNVEEHQRLFRVDGDALIERVGPVLRDAVHPDEPAVLSVKEGQLSALALKSGWQMAISSVTGSMVQVSLMLM